MDGIPTVADELEVKPRQPKKNSEVVALCTVLATIQLLMALGLVACAMFINQLQGANVALAKNQIMLAKGERFPSATHLMPYSVRIRVVNSILGGGNGSGVIVGRKHIVTNCHVAVRGNGTVWVDFGTTQGPQSMVFAVEYMDSAHDLAILKAPDDVEFDSWAKLSLGEDPSPGAAVVAVTCPNGKLPTATSGFYGRRASDGTMELSVNGFWGSSGGPVFDPETGKVLCLMTAMSEPTIEPQTCTRVFPTYLFYGVPANWIADVLRTQGIEN